MCGELRIPTPPKRTRAAAPLRGLFVLLLSCVLYMSGLGQPRTMVLVEEDTKTSTTRIYEVEHQRVSLAQTVLQVLGRKPNEQNNVLKQLCLAGEPRRFHALAPVLPPAHAPPHSPRGPPSA